MILRRRHTRPNVADAARRGVTDEPFHGRIMKLTRQGLVPAAVVISLVAINSTMLALGVIVILIFAIATLTILLRWRGWRRALLDSLAEPAACPDCQSPWLSRKLFEACAPSERKRAPVIGWRTDTAYESPEDVARRRFDAYLLALAGTEQYVGGPCWLRPPVTLREAPAVLDYEYLKKMRPRTADESYCSLTYEFEIQSCACEATRYLNVARIFSDEDGPWRRQIIRGVPVTEETVQRLRELDPNRLAASE